MLKFATVGAGFWARYQLAAWQEVKSAQCIAICDSVGERAESLAHSFGLKIQSFEAVLNDPQIDFIDLITPPATHFDLARRALESGKAVIVQKPLAEVWSEAQTLVNLAEERQLPLLVHENFRWQTPIRRLKDILAQGELGRVYAAELRMRSGFPVFRNQPGLAKLPRFLLNDIGVHILDVARFLFGEVQSVFCSTLRVQPEVAGEDWASVITTHDHVVCRTELGYTQTFYEDDCFPQTLAFIEGTKGTLALRPNYEIRVTTASGTRVEVAPPHDYAWADPDYAVVHASMPDCLRNLVQGLRGGHAETTARDNLRTLAIIEAAYVSAETEQLVHIRT